jgi:hypothetical protein
MTALIIVYVFGVFFVGTCLFWVMKDSGEDVSLVDLVKYCVLTLFSWFAIVLIIMVYFLYMLENYCNKIVIIKRKKENEE